MKHVLEKQSSLQVFPCQTFQKSAYPVSCCAIIRYRVGWLFPISVGKTLRQRIESTDDTSSFIKLGKKSYYYPASVSPTSLENFLLRTVRDMGSLPVSFSARQRHTKVSKTIESRASQLCAQGNGGGCWGAKPVLLQDRVLEPLPHWLH